MKQFHFPLERVRQWRATQLEAEEAKLERLFADREVLNQLEKELDDRLAEAERAVWSAGRSDARPLRSLDGFRPYIGAEKRKLSGRMAECDRSISAQRARVLEERRHAKLLDHLHDRRHTEWKREFDKEIEELAAESYNARFVRNR